MTKIGAIFPQTEIGNDTGAIREYAQTTESLGFDFLLAFDHVLGANAASHPDLTGPYRHTDAFHEPFVLFGYLAAVTNSVELATGIIILPQRQTALVAKQAAAVDVLSNGRLRLGIGVGWNHVEYEALNENWRNRGARSEEQIDVMRQLWTNELITYEGRWHKITDAGILPLPVQRPIPVWLGGASDRTIRRIVNIGDGWILTGRPDDRAKGLIETLHTYANKASRDTASIGLEGWVSASIGGPDEWAKEAAGWKALGATHVSLNTMRAGFDTPAAHIDAITRFKEATAGL
ncbi:MAG: LLM class F420-dependent oxidoreductase [Chloroflexi bacterium]|nr:LLM class F420-dependent oxidoreductase [Chloroflexota bacterium]